MGTDIDSVHIVWLGAISPPIEIILPFRTIKKVEMCKSMERISFHFTSDSETQMKINLFSMSISIFIFNNEINKILHLRAIIIIWSGTIMNFSNFNLRVFSWNLLSKEIGDNSWTFFKINLNGSQNWGSPFATNRGFYPSHAFITQGMSRRKSLLAQGVVEWRP